ncbi:MAG TPA: NADH-quinone oxidoreductase subunit C [bacterium]|nr:NADH-quinone oxidoreductase subunit C [bacterium]
MGFEEIQKKLMEKFEGFVPTTDRAGDPYLTVPAAKIAEILTFCRDDADLAFDCLSNLTGVDAPPDDLEVVYHLFSYSKRHSLTLKVKVPKSNAKLPTVEGVYPTANWQEREAYDLLGMIFEGHSDLRRIMLPDDWVGHPLRKDYKEQEEYRGMATTRPSLLN